ncbi:glycosyltransferase family 2 protein [Streptomyces sp. CRN 30]|uniref:glycosyltransferase family 2 protein n=1 Tax=Streptomyces sp. CRN 30 TaxID=3075613 RepID=UPI002A8302F9|nr:glycosyltransferase [Streptomyces sp. CRN 30]
MKWRFSKSRYDIALIVPCFNVAPYLPACLESIETQRGFDRTQVLLVDDGSEDGTPGLLADFARRHPNARVLTQRNAGPGAARNYAMTEVDAPYLAFADGDDVLREDGLHSMLTCARESKADMVIADFVNVPERPYGRWKQHFGEGDRLITDISEYPEIIFSGSVWNKLYSARFVRRAKLQFADGRLFEDAWFSIPAMLAAKSIYLLDKPVYNYQKRTDRTSIMDSLRTNPANYFDHLELNLHLLRLGDRHPGEVKRMLQRYAAFTYRGFLRKLQRGPSGLDLPALLPSLTEHYRLLPDDVLHEFAEAPGDAELQEAAKNGTLGTLLEARTN